MLDGQTPKWLEKLERRFKWLEIPNLAILLVSLQAIGVFFIKSNPLWAERLALIPEKVLAGELWRLVTFLALPLSTNLLFVIFVLWFLYFIVSSLEEQWGAFKTTFYVLVSLGVTILYSFGLGYPVTNVHHFESTLFLAAAALFPNFEVQLFLILPVKMRWLAYLTLIFLVLQLIQGTWLDRGYLLAIYSNFLLFFGPSFIYRIRQMRRKKSFQRKMKP